MSGMRKIQIRHCSLPTAWKLVFELGPPHPSPPHPLTPSPPHPLTPSPPHPLTPSPSREQKNISQVSVLATRLRCSPSLPPLALPSSHSTSVRCVPTGKRLGYTFALLSLSPSPCIAQQPQYQRAMCSHRQTSGLHVCAAPPSPLPSHCPTATVPACVVLPQASVWATRSCCWCCTRGPSSRSCTYSRSCSARRPLRSSCWRSSTSWRGWRRSSPSSSSVSPNSTSWTWPTPSSGPSSSSPTTASARAWTTSSWTTGPLTCLIKRYVYVCVYVFVYAYVYVYVFIIVYVYV